MKPIGVALLAGLMSATIVATATRSRPPAGPNNSAIAAPDASMRISALDRCRAISAPDIACEATWDAEHRRFFGRQVR